MKRSFSYLLILLALSTLCLAEPVPPELQGVWRASGQIPAPPGQESMSWMLEYTFLSDGTYKMTGYPPITESGHLDVLAEKAGHYILKFSQRIFMNNKSSDLSYPAKLNSTQQSIQFHDKTFRRVIPKG